MSDEVEAFEQWCRESWGAPTRDHKQVLARGVPQICAHVDWAEACLSLKVCIAEKLILESCSRIGSFAESGDVSWCIRSFARELAVAGIGFKGRRLQPLKAALLLSARLDYSSALPAARDDFDHIRAGGGAMATMFLMAQLEFLCRVKSRYLHRDGKVRREIPPQLLNKAGFKSKPSRVNRIDQAWVLCLYKNITALGKRLRILERKLQIAQRLGTLRNPVMHGEWPDPAFEAMFLALLVAMFYYSESAA